MHAETATRTQADSSLRRCFQGQSLNHRTFLFLLVLFLALLPRSLSLSLALALRCSTLQVHHPSILTPQTRAAESLMSGEHISLLFSCLTILKCVFVFQVSSKSCAAS